MKREDIKAEVEFTKGIEERFTVACLNQLKKRKNQLNPPVVKNPEANNQTA